MSRNGPAAAGGKGVLELTGTIADPRMWDPDYPYLYTVAITLRASVRTVDSQRIPCGIRTARWDVNGGLFLNGKHLKLHGWGQKPTDE